MCNVSTQQTPAPLALRDGSAVSYRDKAIWRAALTLAHNLCVQTSNRINDNDGPLEIVHALSDEARRIRGWMEPTYEQLSEMFEEAGVVPTNAKGQPWRHPMTDPTTPAIAGSRAAAGSARQMLTVEVTRREFRSLPASAKRRAMRAQAGKTLAAAHGSEVWLVFQWTTYNSPMFQGVFDTEDAAVAACRTDLYCVCPAQMNKALPHELELSGPGAWYPGRESRPPNAAGSATEGRP